jgi:hypothetical protein
MIDRRRRAAADAASISGPGGPAGEVAMTDTRTLDQVLYARGDIAKLPKGWHWGAHFSGRGGAIQGHYAVRKSDGCCVMVVDTAESDAPTPAAAIRAAIAAGTIPRARRRAQGEQ